MGDAIFQFIRARMSLFGSAILLCLALSTAASPAAAFINAPRTGDQLPAVTLRDRYGEDIRLHDIRGDRPLLLSFFSVTCKPCRKELPYLQSFHEKYGDRLAVVLVSVDWGGHKSFEPHREEHGITFPVLHDSTRKVKARLGAFSLPKLFLVEGNGVIREIMIGFIPEEAGKLEGRIRSLIGD